MMTALKIIAWIIGVGLLGGGAVMLVLTLMFGSGGPFDGHRRDRSGEALFAGAAFVGCVVLALLAFL